MILGSGCRKGGGFSRELGTVEAVCPREIKELEIWLPCSVRMEDFKRQPLAPAEEVVHPEACTSSRVGSPPVELVREEWSDPIGSCSPQPERSLIPPVPKVVEAFVRSGSRIPRPEYSLVRLDMGMHELTFFAEGLVTQQLVSDVVWYLLGLRMAFVVDVTCRILLREVVEELLKIVFSHQKEWILVGLHPLDTNSKQCRCTLQKLVRQIRL